MPRLVPATGISKMAVSYAVFSAVLRWNMNTNYKNGLTDGKGSLFRFSSRTYPWPVLRWISPQTLTWVPGAAAAASDVLPSLAVSFGTRSVPAGCAIGS